MKWIALVAVFLCVDASQAQQMFNVTGSVKSASGPVAGAIVRVGPPFANPLFTATTDAQGRFSGKAPPMFLNAEASLPGRNDLLADGVSFQLDYDTEIRFKLEPPVRLSGQVISPGSPASHIDIRNLSGRQGETFDTDNFQPRNGSFGASLHPDVYSIQAIPHDLRLAPARINLDLRGGGSPAIRLTVGGDEGALVPKRGPDAKLVRIDPPDDDGVSIIRGLPGAAEGLNAILIVNLHTGQMAFATSELDGSFSARMFAPPGSSLQIKTDPTGRYAIAGIGSGFLDGAPATVIDVPPPKGLQGVGFATGGLIDNSATVGTGPKSSSLSSLDRIGARDGGVWWMYGEIDNRELQAGDLLKGRGTLVIYSHNISDATAGEVRVTMELVLEKLFDQSGVQHRSSQYFSSSVLTPTGFPIEVAGWGRRPQSTVPGQSVWRIRSFRRTAQYRLEAEWTLEARIPQLVPPGLYRPFIPTTITGITSTPLHFDVFPSLGVLDFLPAALPLLKIGAVPTPRLFWVLALDEFSDGSRGVVAEEDRDRSGVSTNVIIAKRDFVLPMVDARTGRAITYSLEPYVPLMSESRGGPSTPPKVALRLPSGSLSVQVIRPDGTIHDLGAAPFRQWRMQTPLTRRGNPTSNSTSHPSDYFQLITDEARFNYQFQIYGLHRILVAGSVEDVWGTTYEGGDEYRIWVARLLDIETGLMPGTPFEVGNAIPPTVVIKPPLPADIDFEVQLMPESDPAKTVRFSASGKANRFGQFNPPPLPKLTAAGEYRIDVRARYLDPQGVLWMNSASWGSVVETPKSLLITHGRRGYDFSDVIGDQWFFFRGSLQHVQFPFHSGDVMWFADTPGGGFSDMPKITIQDTAGTFAARMRTRAARATFERPNLETRITAGEIPLISTLTGQDETPPPDEKDEWGYWYAFAERPGVRVREMISEDFNGTGYWRFSDSYFAQLGVGSNGDLPNDFKFQFGGAVYRAPKDNFFHYGAYGSLFVLIPENDPLGGRIFPPFQGNGGGPSGGPIMRFKGKEIDIFFHPTGVRPGTILQTGEIASFAGQLGPTLPGKVEIVIASPSGAVRAIRGQANKVGYFYDPEQDFTVDEAGVWRATVKVFFDGLTSAGPARPPYPTGDLLGSREGEFYFYVVGSDSTPLGVAPSIAAAFVRPAEGPITFSITPPAGLANLEMTYTTVMPGFILDEGRTTALTYTYDAPKLARDFPNLDLFDADGFAGVDTITIGFLVSGTDSTGARRHFARQIVLQGEELQISDQKASLPRRRP